MIPCFVEDFRQRKNLNALKSFDKIKTKGSVGFLNLNSKNSPQRVVALRKVGEKSKHKVNVDLKYFLLSYPALTVRLFPYSVFCFFVKKYPDFGPIIQDLMLPKRFVEILPSRVDYK